MKTGMIIKTGAVLMLAAFLGSCSPDSSKQTRQVLPSPASSSNIIGGVNSTSEYQKANGIVGLLVVYKNQLGREQRATCTSSLIAKNIVVTAAHCLAIPPDTEFVGAFVYFTTDRSVAMEELFSKDLSHIRVVDNLVRHEKYMLGESSANDIGLIHFDGEMPEGFQLATRASTENSAIMKAGAVVTLAGFGVSDYKMDARSGQLSGEGSGLLRQISDIGVVSLSASGEEITLDQTQGRGACHGDSGGPAYLVNPTTQKTVLVGVTSRGTERHGLCNEQAIYTAVAGYEKWIDARLAEWAAEAVSQ